MGEGSGANRFIGCERSSSAPHCDDSGTMRIGFPGNTRASHRSQRRGTALKCGCSAARPRQGDGARGRRRPSERGVWSGRSLAEARRAAAPPSRVSRAGPDPGRNGSFRGSPSHRFRAAREAMEPGRGTEFGRASKPRRVVSTDAAPREPIRRARSFIAGLSSSLSSWLRAAWQRSSRSRRAAAPVGRPERGARLRRSRPDGRSPPRGQRPERRRS